MKKIRAEVGERRQNWCFWTVVWEKTLESPLDCKGIQPVKPKGNKFWIFIGRTDAEAEGFGHLMQRTDSLEKTLMVGKIEDRRRRGWQRMRWLDGIANLWKLVWVSSGSWWWTGKPGMLQSMGSQRVGHEWATELNWTSVLPSLFSWFYPSVLIPSLLPFLYFFLLFS